MHTVIVEFKELSKEVNLYLNFLKDIINKNAKLQYKDDKKIRTKQINKELIKMLKANFFLILYNLIESSFRKTLKKICHEVTVDQTQFNNSIPEIKKIWIKEYYKSFKKINQDANPNKLLKESDYILEKIENIAADIVTIEYSKNAIGGNIDGRKIRQKFLKYGLPIKLLEKPLKMKLSSKLEIIKNKRNDLAHGLISFSDCGRDFTIEELIEIKKQALSFMLFILKYVNKQLNCSYYKVF